MTSGFKITHGVLSFEIPAAHQIFLDYIQENSSGTLGSQNVLVKEKKVLQLQEKTYFLFLVGNLWQG